MPEDEAFYYLHEDGELKDAVKTHVDDFELAGTNDFIIKIIQGFSQWLIISKVKRGRFRFMGLDVWRQEDRIILSMEDYVRSQES